MFSHQGLADKHGIDAVGLEVDSVLVRRDPAFSDDGYFLGNVRPEANDVSQVDLEGFQVAIIDADELGAGV